MILAWLIVTLATLVSGAASAAAPDWSEGAVVSPQGQPNRYELPPEQFFEEQSRGRIHTQIYPVEVTGALPPYRPLEKALRMTLGLTNTDQLFSWIGLHPYPQVEDKGVYSVPYPNGVRPTTRMGLGLIETPRGTGFTFSCAECHSANLFGKTVLGMTNRFPRANETFILAKEGLPLVSKSAFKNVADATPGEMQMLQTLKKNLKSVGVKKPQVLGLDTSLAQVALSLAHRGTDEYATKNAHDAAHPRDEVLATRAADSKPAVWWNLKYKNRWLSDGSVVSGNPIYTNILWNEIGRGGDLRELQDWFARNDGTIRELTTAVFSTEAPRFTDFFPPERIDLSRAQHGETIYNARCAGCHGHYEKGWSADDADQRTLIEKLETTRVTYHDKTPVIDVGTDPGRYQGMDSLARGLNPLAISRANGIVIRPQKGYVPPPLVGIWARWPYFHNNSAPTLCAVLTRHEDRPKRWTAGEANDPDRDFDSVCNGYPLGNRAPQEWAWKNRGAFYDTSREGMSNAGHDERIFLKDGKELLTPTDKADLILFLQTL